jgi:hypothetical protein
VGRSWAKNDSGLRAQEEKEEADALGLGWKRGGAAAHLAKE